MVNTFHAKQHGLTLIFESAEIFTVLGGTLTCFLVKPSCFDELLLSSVHYIYLKTGSCSSGALQLSIIYNKTNNTSIITTLSKFVKKINKFFTITKTYILF